jgi:hypothetical protein
MTPGGIVVCSRSQFGLMHVPTFSLPPERAAPEVRQGKVCVYILSPLAPRGRIVARCLFNLLCLNVSPSEVL